MTTKLRLRAALATNAAGTAWVSLAFTFGLHPVTFTGNGFTVVPNLAAAVAGSTVVLTPTGNSQKKDGVSSEISLPADGHYVVGVNLAAAIGDTRRAALLYAALQVRHV